jgi:hypothetical protein
MRFVLCLLRLLDTNTDKIYSILIHSESETKKATYVESYGNHHNKINVKSRGCSKKSSADYKKLASRFLGRKESM